MRADEQSLRLEGPLDWRYKGFPAPTGSGGLTLGDLAEQGWNVLAGDLLFPVAVLKETALEHNLELMSHFCREHDVSLAPHGKTTMAPELVRRQLEAGAWGVTAATTSQVRVFRTFGFQRIVLANQLVEPAALGWIADELLNDQTFDFYCLVDSLEGVAAMEAALSEHGSARPIQVLIELGIQGGRTGCRTIEEAKEVAQAAITSQVLELAGVEGFEGIIHEPELADTLARVDAFVGQLRELATELDTIGCFDDRDEVILTVGGSAFFDHVVANLPPPLGKPVRLVLRSGCYVTHDSGLYATLSPLDGRGTGDPLEHALEVWGVVLSRPEPDLAIVGLGKRDVSYDIDLPVPLHAESGSGLRSVHGQMTIFDLNDQHAYVRVPVGDQLAPGNLVGCGISHPCTTFDKWRLIPVVDDDYRVVDAVQTFF